MKVGVLGAGGLIGAAVWARLAREVEVLRLGRQAAGKLRLDLVDEATLARADLSGLDALVHCAGVTDEDLAADLPLAFKKAVVGADLLSRRARECGVARLVYFSSAHVYGPLEGRISEDSPANPLRAYAIAQFATEQVLRRHAGEGGCRVLVVRAGNVYGPPADWALFRRWSLIPFSFPEAAVRCGRIELKTRGDQSLNFVAAADLAELLASILPDEGGPAFEVVNGVGAETLSVYEFARRCAGLSERRTGIPCTVVRPEGGGPAPARLELAARRPGPAPRGRLDDFLATIFDWLLAHRPQERSKARE